jgi:hypothetical protein
MSRVIRIQYRNHTSPKGEWEDMHTPPAFTTLAEAESWLDKEMLRWIHGTQFRIMVQQKWLEEGILYEVDAPAGRRSV